MFRSSMERYVMVVLLLAAGMRFLGLTPLHVLAGFVAGQVSLVAAGLLWNGLEK